MSDIFDLILKGRELANEVATWPGIKKRSWKSEYASIEISLLEKFSKALESAPLIEIDGFVSRTGKGRSFILRPSFAVDYGIFCNASQLKRLPTDYEFGRVKGWRILEGKSRMVDRGIIEATDFEPIRLPSDQLKPELSTGDAGGILMEGYVDPPDQLTRSLLLSLTSTPGEQNAFGGLTAALMPVRETYSEQLFTLLEGIRSEIPLDLTSENVIPITVAGAGRFDISPFPWSVRNVNGSRGSRTQSSLLSRASTSPTLQELTIGFSSESLAPRSLDEVWIRQADFPILTEPSLRRYETQGSMDLELAKFLITVHISTHFPRPDKESPPQCRVQGTIR